MIERHDRHNAVSSEGGGPGRSPRGVVWLLALLAGLGFHLPGCLALGGETLEWKEEAALQDGGTVIVSRRLQLVPGEPFKTMPGPRRLTFTHPMTGESIVWENAGKIGSRVMPGLLDFDAGKAVLVTMAQSGPDYDGFGCPTPPYIVFRYEAGTWTRIPMQELPARFRWMNLTMDPDREFLEAHGYFVRAADITAMNRKRPLDDHRALLVTVDRRIRNPLAAESGMGCSRGAVERIYGVEKYQQWRGTGIWLNKSEDEVRRLLHGKTEGGKP